MHTFDNLNKMDKFLERYKLPTQLKNSLNSLIYTKEIKLEIKVFPQREVIGKDYKGELGNVWKWIDRFITFIVVMFSKVNTYVKTSNCTFYMQFIEY